MKILHLTTSAAASGSLKQTCRKIVGSSNDVLDLDYPFDVDAVPVDFSQEEIARCVKLAHSKISTNEVVFDRISNINLEDYDKVFIWHAENARSVMTMCFLCKNFNHPLYRIEKDLSCETPISADEYNRLVESAKLITEQERERYIANYNELIGTDGIPKVLENGKVVCKSKDYVKSLILDELGEKPQSVYPFVGKVYQKFHKRYGFDFTYIELMILEMIQDDKITPSDIETEPETEHQSSFEVSFSLDFTFRGRPIKDWFKFSISLA